MLSEFLFESCNLLAGEDGPRSSPPGSCGYPLEQRLGEEVGVVGGRGEEVVWESGGGGEGDSGGRYRGKSERMRCKKRK